MLRSVLFKGILTDRGRNLHPQLKSVQAHRELYSQLLSEDVPSLSVMATKFALSFPEVSSVLVGIDRTEYLQKALEVADGKYLGAEMLARARELAYPEPEFLDLHKWDVLSWLR